MQDSNDKEESGLNQSFLSMRSPDSRGAGKRELRGTFQEKIRKPEFKKLKESIMK